jgi:hypothetical protein
MQDLNPLLLQGELESEQDGCKVSAILVKDLDLEDTSKRKCLRIIRLASHI